MKRFALLFALLWLPGCAVEDLGDAPYVEEGSATSSPILMQAQAGIETNTPPEKSESVPDTQEETGPPQDRTGESDPNTGDDANPDSLQPEPRY